MNRTTWANVRQYIEVEIQLAALREQRASTPTGAADRKAGIARLEALSTSIETAIREALPESASEEAMK